MAKTTTNIYIGDVEIKVNRYADVSGKERVNIRLDGEDNYFSLETAVKLQEALEKVVVDKEYRYENMQAENDRLQDRVNELEELLDNIGYEEAV